MLTLGLRGLHFPFGWVAIVTVVMLLWRFSALIFTEHNNFVYDLEVYLDKSKKINYLLNRLRAMPSANFTPKQFCLHVVLSPSKRALEPQPNNYVEYIFSIRGKSIERFCRLVCRHAV